MYSNYFFKSKLFSLVFPMLLRVKSCGVLAKSVNKTPRTVFGLFFLSSSQSLSEEQLNITVLINCARKMTESPPQPFLWQ